MKENIESLNLEQYCDTPEDSPTQDCQKLTLQLNCAQANEVKQGLRLVVEEHLQRQYGSIKRWLDDPKIDLPQNGSPRINDLLELYLMLSCSIYYHFNNRPK